MIRRSTVIAIAAALTVSFGGKAMAEDEMTPGNRYDKPRYYHSEISAADAFLEVKNAKWRKHRRKPVLIDVRRLREYAAGHPYRSYNVPFPHIEQSPFLGVDENGDPIPNPDYVGQDPDNFVNEVYDIVKGDHDRLIMLLCRTGARSVDAGNVLADAGFTNVRNIWEGFVGQYKHAYAGGDILFVRDEDGNVVLDEDGEPITIKLDLNNDGEINTDMADVYEETTDYNPDKDGWRNFTALPWTTAIRRPLAYENNVWQYREWMTPVE